MIITRKEYMKTANEPGKIDVFYGQFVNDAILCLIKSNFPNPDIKVYSLDKWDAFVDYTKTLIDRNKWRAAMEWDNPLSYPWSKSDNVCILKTAHKMFHKTGE